MVIAVLEGRSVIGLHRAATKGQIRTPFLSEAIPLAVLGGAASLAVGASSTFIGTTNAWAIVVPALA